MYCSADLSLCEKYRFKLVRGWDKTKPGVCFVMLNPSTADAEQDDATIRKCLGFAKRWGYGWLVVVNLFSYRSTDPRNLYKIGNPKHVDDDKWILDAANSAMLVVCAWGRHGRYRGRGAEVLKLLRDAGRIPWAIKMNGDGTPAHPVMLGYDNKLLPVPQ